jgi:tRNA1Val (adenine37-N6)-methyltransferase
MSSKPFHFKRFSVAQDHSTHKVGTDGVLLGSWVNIREADKRMLDIGTGCGLIALMLAQRSRPGIHIDAIDIEERDVQQAIVNVAKSPWADKVFLWHVALQDFIPPNQYDLIVSNPPFFVNSLKPPEEKRTRARHAQSLSFEDLVNHVVRLLSPQGRFAAVLPYTEANQFSALASGKNLFVLRQASFRARSTKPVERVLMEFCLENKSVEKSEFVLYEEGGDNWTEAYRSLTRDFYLKA